MCTIGIMASQVEGVPYQKWAGYPDTPVLTSMYPYQVIADFDNLGVEGTKRLFVSQSPLWHTISSSWNYVKVNSANSRIEYRLSNGNWVQDSTTFSDEAYNDSGAGNQLLGLKQANYPIYTDSSYSTIFFNKTTA